MEKNKKRLTAEKNIIELMNKLDKSGWNGNRYKKIFSKMSNVEFTKFMKALANDDEFLYFEVGDNDKDIVTTNKIKAVAKQEGVEIEEYVLFRHKNPLDPEKPVVSNTKAMILNVNVRRLQQLLIKKNAMSSQIESINPLTGQVSGSARSASLTDAQSTGLVAVGLEKNLKEAFGPRSDDVKASEVMHKKIEQSGTVRLEDLPSDKGNKRSIQVVETFMLGGGIKAKF